MCSSRPVGGSVGREQLSDKVEKRDGRVHVDKSELVTSSLRRVTFDGVTRNEKTADDIGARVAILFLSNLTEELIDVVPRQRVRARLDFPHPSLTFPWRGPHPASVGCALSCWTVADSAAETSQHFEGFRPLVVSAGQMASGFGDACGQATTALSEPLVPDQEESIVRGRVYVASRQALGGAGEPHEPSRSRRGGYGVFDGTASCGKVGRPTAVEQDVGLNVPPEGTVLGLARHGKSVRGCCCVSGGAVVVAEP